MLSTFWQFPWIVSANCNMSIIYLFTSQYFTFKFNSKIFMKINMKMEACCFNNFYHIYFLTKIQKKGGHKIVNLTWSYHISSFHNKNANLITILHKQNINHIMCKKTITKLCLKRIIFHRNTSLSRHSLF
jgi:hypothetical protein